MVEPVTGSTEASARPNRWARWALLGLLIAGRAWALHRSVDPGRSCSRGRQPCRLRFPHLRGGGRFDRHSPRRPSHRLVVDLDRFGGVVRRRARWSASCIPAVGRLGLELGLESGVLLVRPSDFDLPLRASAGWQRSVGQGGTCRGLGASYPPGGHGPDRDVGRCRILDRDGQPDRLSPRMDGLCRPPRHRRHPPRRRGVACDQAAPGTSGPSGPSSLWWYSHSCC